MTFSQKSLIDDASIFGLKPMEQRPSKNINNYLIANIYSYLETSGGQSSILYSNVVEFFNTSVDQTSVTAKDCSFPTLVSNMQCSINQ